MNGRKQEDTRWGGNYYSLLEQFIHLGGGGALDASQQPSDESFLREALTHFSQINKKHTHTHKTVPHEGFEIINHRRCIQQRSSTKFAFCTPLFAELSILSFLYPAVIPLIDFILVLLHCISPNKFKLGEICGTEAYRHLPFAFYAFVFHVKGLMATLKVLNLCKFPCVCSKTNYYEKY